MLFKPLGDGYSLLHSHVKDRFYIRKKGKTKFTVRFRSLKRFDTIPGRFNPKQSRNLINFCYSVCLHACATIFLLDKTHVS
jgi:hypothetical protein